MAGWVFSLTVCLVLVACGFIKRDSKAREQDCCGIKQQLTLHCCLTGRYVKHLLTAPNMDTIVLVFIAPDFKECFVYSLQASGPLTKTRKPPSKPAASSGGGAKKGGEGKKNGKQAGNGEVAEDDPAGTSGTPKKGAKDTSRKRKAEESSPALPAANQESPVCVKRAKTAKDNNRDLGLCRYVPLACSYSSFY